jgi:GH15 family glucan-1,4-alpha-glucosidase
MASPIEDYALLSDTQSAALVAKDGSIDWLTFPRFDSAACFAALLGKPEHGRWQIAPAGGVQAVRRHYRDGTLVLETEFQTEDGVVAVIDCMPVRDSQLDLVRLVEGRTGRVPMTMDLILRMDYGSITPWARRVSHGMEFVAGPDALTLRTPVDLQSEHYSTRASFEVRAGDVVPFHIAWHPSHLSSPNPLDPVEAVNRTESWWLEWASHSTHESPWTEAVERSLVVLKGLTYAPTGGIVAAATTSLPEEIGGERNWDYRFCWLRDATFTLMALMSAGFTEEASSWRDWLLRAVAGRPDQAQIMYGPAGEHRLTELEVEWLPGYEDSAPVRIGNAAHGQFQLDVYGEVLDALHQGFSQGLKIKGHSWELARELVVAVEDLWHKPDDGIWEVRGGRRHFTHSKVMAWVALDRAIHLAEDAHHRAPVDRWKAARAEIHKEILEEGVDDRGVFVQSYGSKALDASLLLIPQVGFLPPHDDRVVNTVEAIQKELTEDGFVRRYLQSDSEDGLSGEEGVFLMCSFWLADDLALMGRTAEATRLFQRLLDLRNDVGLLSEEYDPSTGRLLGNIPQAFSHVSLISTANNLNQAKPAMTRGAHPLDA